MFYGANDSLRVQIRDESGCLSDEDIGIVGLQLAEASSIAFAEPELDAVCKSTVFCISSCQFFLSSRIWLATPEVASPAAAP